MSVDDESEPADTPPPPLQEATAVVEADDGYNVELSPAYRTAVGPFGGYLATIALRAAARATEKPRPASLSCHFLNVADPGLARVRVSLRHETRRAASVAIDLHQGGRPILSAVAWFVADATGIDHDPPHIPHVPPVALATPFDEVHKGAGFWFLESRPIYQPSLTQPAPPGRGPWSFNQLEYFVDEHDPALGAWTRLRPQATFDENALDAARAVVASDWLIPFVAAARYSGRRVVLHSSLDLTVSFHATAPTAEWLYCHARVGVARGGISHGEAQVWAEDGTPIATAMQQMVQRIRL